MREIHIIELKQIQLDILSALDKFCSENNIHYSIAAGTLIGAVRHKGYIPWDDDIDVFMLRDEYNKLISSFPELYEGKYIFRSLERDSKYCVAYGNMCDIRTTMLENATTEATSVNIDVFPVDDVPAINEGWQKYIKGLAWLVNFKNIKLIKYSRKRSLLKNAFLSFAKFLLMPFSLKFFVNKINIYSQKCNGLGFEWVYFSCFGPYGRKLPHLKSDYDDFVDFPFEGRHFKAMKGYADYLTSVYGDYMQLPPVEKRVSQHGFKAYWKD